MTEPRKYRGIADGKWVKGWYLKYSKSANGPDYIFPNNNKKFLDQFIEVIPETVGQSTGLKDKNGTEKWGGDIVQGSDGVVRIVEWHNGGFIERESARDWKLIDNQGEVIGNKWENPDLLKGDNDD